MVYLLTAIGLSPGGSSTVHTNNMENNTNNKEYGRVRTVPRHCEFYPGICLTTEEKARKNLSQGKKNLRVQYTYYKNTHALQNLHKHTRTHVKKQYKTTTVQIKTNTTQDIPK